MYCSNCGSKQNDGAKFCSECGKSLLVSNQNSMETSAFAGIQIKCRSCGEPLDSYTSKCPLCGWEVRGANVARYVQNFTDRLNSSISKDERINLIKNYAVPNTKEDLIEFILLSVTNIDSCDSVKESKAWILKLEQLYQKFTMTISSGPDYDRISTVYNETKQKIHKKKIIAAITFVPRCIFSILKAIKTILILIFKGTSAAGEKIPALFEYLGKNTLFFLSVLAFLRAIIIDSNNGNGSGFELLGGILSVTGAVILIKGKSKYIDILTGGACGVLSFYLAEELRNGSFLQLNGVITLAIVFIAFIKKATKKTTTEGE